ncbi:MAG: hypothetical protein ACYC0B_02140 [Gemmatimonadaceae bacterium]
MSLKSLLTDGGRKYAVVITTLRMGFTLALLGLAVAAVVPAVAMHVAAIVGAFGVLGSVAVGAYQYANAQGDKWNPTDAEGNPLPRPSTTNPVSGGAS